MKNNGFTLAEVLITLGVIGVVAAITMPTLIQKHKEQVYITRLKQNYSIFSQALKMAELEHGAFSEWTDSNMSNLEKSQTIMKNLKPYLKIIKDCTGYGNCLSNKAIMYIHSTNKTTGNMNHAQSSFGKGVLSNGTVFWIEPLEDDTKLPNNVIRAALDIDLNGVDTPPNRMGEDFFYFWITDKGIIPRGTPDSTEGQDFEDKCLNRRHACTAWVLANQNLDYLHCPEKLGWNKASSCK